MGVYTPFVHLKSLVFGNQWEAMGKVYSQREQ